MPWGREPYRGEDGALRIHEPDKCDDVYGKGCNGIATWGTDPFREEIYLDYTEDWDCWGSRRGSAMEI